MLTPRTTLLLLALLLATPADLIAQQEPVATEDDPVQVRAGDRVRVTAPGLFLGRLVGRVVTLTADSCVLKIEGRADTTAIALASLTKLEVRRGQRSHWLEGAAIGVVAGMVVGYTFSYPLGAACTAEVYDRCIATGGSLIGGVLGFLIGADLGRKYKGDRWQRVPLDRLRVGLGPAPGGGLAAAISITF